MKLQSLFFTLILFVICSAANNGNAQDNQDQHDDFLSDYSISGPYECENLSIFLFHGKDKIKERKFITLFDAIAQEKVIIHETGNVNSLKISNNSKDEYIYIQAGIIVKGGKQDRTFGSDTIIPPDTKQASISSFCVEQGRWSSRSDISDQGVFYESKKMLPSKELKIAAKVKKSQGDVWQRVNEAQTDLGGSLGLIESIDDQATTSIIEQQASPNLNSNIQFQDQSSMIYSQIGSASSILRPQEATTNSLLHGESPSSLQLALENKELTKELGIYQEKLKGLIADPPDALGFAFAINGEFNSADVYGSHALFETLWERLLEASATEAIALKGQPKKGTPTVDEIKEALADVMKANAKNEQINKSTTNIMNQSSKNVLLQTEDDAGNAIHWNWIQY